MKPEIKKLWVERLRDLPPEMQGSNQLKNSKGQMCCLGVLCELAVENGVPVTTKAIHGGYWYDDATSLVPASVRDWAGLDSSNPLLSNNGRAEYASAWNDVYRKSFADIADMIEVSL